MRRRGGDGARSRALARLQRGVFHPHHVLRHERGVLRLHARDDVSIASALDVVVAPSLERRHSLAPTRRARRRERQRAHPQIRLERPHARLQRARPALASQHALLAPQKLALERSKPRHDVHARARLARVAERVPRRPSPPLEIAPRAALFAPPSSPRAHSRLVSQFHLLQLSRHPSRAFRGPRAFRVSRRRRDVPQRRRRRAPSPRASPPPASTRPRTPSTSKPCVRRPAPRTRPRPRRASAFASSAVAMRVASSRNAR